MTAQNLRHSGVTSMPTMFCASGNKRDVSKYDSLAKLTGSLKQVKRTLPESRFQGHGKKDRTIKCL